MKVGSFSFGSPVSASSVSKPIFEIKANDNKNNISTPMLSRSVKNIVFFGCLAASTSPKGSRGGFAAYSRTSVSGEFMFGSSKEGIEFETFSEMKT